RASDSFRSFRELRQIVGDREPRRLAGDVDVKRRPDAGVVIQGAERQTVVSGMRFELADNRRAAYAAKASAVSGRGFVERDQILALDPFEIPRAHARAGAEGASLRLAAHRAMAIARVEQRTSDAIFHAAAQATAADHGHLHPNRPATATPRRER